MKNILILAAITIQSFSSFSQKVIDEDFNTGLGVFDDSQGSAWSLNSTIAYSDTQAAHCVYTSDSKYYLELTNSVDLSSYSGAKLEFQHIAKIEIADQAYLQISTNGGATWTKLDTNYYTGNSILLYGSNFFDGSYSGWEFNVEATPDSSWWKSESFNLSAFTGNGFDDVKIRFYLNSDDSRNFYGWLIDDVVLTVTQSGEYDPPVIIHTALSNSGSTESYKVSATITDSSGLNSAVVYYRVDESTWNGPNAMTNTTENTYTYSIPGQNQGSIVDYYIEAIDASGFGNTAYHPSNAPNTYNSFDVITAIFQYPYKEDFETVTATQWYHKAELTIGNTGITPYDDWLLGKPLSKSYFNNTYSGSKAYITQTSMDYRENSRSALYSPKFDFSIITQPELSFYHMYDIGFEDGGRIDYSTNDGFTWTVLGYSFDPLGENWYTEWQISSASNVQSRPGWQGNETSDWVLSKYDLSNLTLGGNFIQFRFSFTSGFNAWGYDGWIMDDFRITDLAIGIADKNPINNFELHQNYPNPCKEQTTISYTLANNADVSIQIYNDLGEMVYDNFEGNLPKGSYNELIDLSNFSSGLYLYHFKAGDVLLSKRMIVIN
ncbi:MAG: T9SS type A sorting domain-containing protein [Bacteroidia bacterium]|nr:T9SS type A sorting domain-containing protein [Bacteroidia bacterium]